MTDNRTLEKLSVSGSCFCTEFVQQVCDMVVCNPTLTHFHLHVDEEGTVQIDSSTWKLILATCANAQIVYLSLGEMEWDNDLKFHLSEIINNTTSLCLLDLVFSVRFASSVNDDMCNQILTPSSVQHVWIHGTYRRIAMNMNVKPCSTIVMTHG